MPTANKSREQSNRSNSSGEFTSRYTRDDAGFYVRNSKPSSSPLTAKRINENVKDLLQDNFDSNKDQEG
jgi:hypothetical protein